MIVIIETNTEGYMNYNFLMAICIILFTTKVFGVITGRLQIPQVVGALLAGLVLGPLALGIIEPSEFLEQLGELGVIVIMFGAGMETNIDDLKHAGKSSVLIALLGVLIPLGMGAGLTYLFNPGGNMLENIFIGTVLTATSVSITVETLKEMGKLSTRVGNTILAAALIDDILGLICLTIVISLSGSGASIAVVLVKIVLFFVFIAITGFVAHHVFQWYGRRVHNKNLHRFPIMAFAMCLFMAWTGEVVFGVANIIGAFAAGLVISTTSKSHYIMHKFDPLSYLLLSPIFFANIGLSVSIPSMSNSIILYAVLLLAVGLISKIVGCGIGAKFSNFSNRQALQIGIGMACRGEVALIVANKGMALGLVPEEFFGPIIIMVIGCTIFTPSMLKAAFKGCDSPNPEIVSKTHERHMIKQQMEAIIDQMLHK